MSGGRCFIRQTWGLSKASVLINRINMAMGTGWKAQMRRLTAGEFAHRSGGGCVDNRLARKQSWNRWDVLAAGMARLGNPCMMVRSFSVSYRRVGPNLMRTGCLMPAIFSRRSSMSPGKPKKMTRHLLAGPMPSTNNRCSSIAGSRCMP